MADSSAATFFVPHEPHLDRLVDIDPDTDWQMMRGGERWLLQTFLRLKSAGCPVVVSDRVPSSGIVVFIRGTSENSSDRRTVRGVWCWWEFAAIEGSR